MSLKDTINNTNTQKENIKTVASNIDNKLVELGGERAKDLNDVANKMGAMVGQYKKFAEAKPNYEFQLERKSSNTVDIPLGLDFTPSSVTIKLSVHEGQGIAILNSKMNKDSTNYVEYNFSYYEAILYIEAISKEKLTLNYSSSATFTTTALIEHIIAIG